MIKFLIPTLIILLYSCNSSPKPIQPEKNSNTWSTFRIKIENNEHKTSFDETITVFFDTDTGYYYKRTIDTTYFKEHRRFPVIDKKFILSQAERDSLFTWANNTITKPVLSDQHVSCYAGKEAIISLSNGNSKISCSYSSQMAWTGISSNFLKINSLTFDKLKD